MSGPVSGPVGGPGPGEQLLQLEVEAPAPGGHCVARHEGRVVFVRHALPGELVLARVEQPGERDRFWRAEAVQVLRAAPERVPPRCPVAGPGGCGGCDWQHVELGAQRELKARVVREQLRRVAGVELPELTVEPVPGDADGLGWRTRVRFAVDAEGRTGLRAHRSHRVVPVARCPIAHPAVTATGVGEARWRAEAVEVIAGREEPLVIVEPGEAAGRGRPAVPPTQAGISVAVAGPQGLERVRGRTWVTEEVVVAGEPRRFRVTGSGFWQVHPGAAQTLLDAVLDAAAPPAGGRALDLYCGVGLFAAGLARAVGPDGEVVAVESDARACADARRNLHDLPAVRLLRGAVEQQLPLLVGTAAPDVAVVDPPRAGLGRAVVTALTALAPATVVYVSCDPATLARDLGLGLAAGYRLRSLRALDLFPMTRHVECVAVLERVG